MGFVFVLSHPSKSQIAMSLSRVPVNRAISSELVMIGIIVTAVEFLNSTNYGI